MNNQLATRREAAARAFIALSGNLNGATVYGSFSRPFSTIWARAEDVQRATLGHPDNGGTHEVPHTYLICKEPLTPESVYNYELTLVIAPGPTPEQLAELGRYVLAIKAQHDIAAALIDKRCEEAIGEAGNGWQDQNRIEDEAADQRIEVDCVVWSNIEQAARFVVEGKPLEDPARQMENFTTPEEA